MNFVCLYVHTHKHSLFVYLFICIGSCKYSKLFTLSMSVVNIYICTYLKKRVDI